jgi:hypothetical protein
MNPPLRVPISSNTFIELRLHGERNMRPRFIFLIAPRRPGTSRADCPIRRRIDTGPDIDAARAVTLEMPMLQIDARPTARLGCKANFHFARLRHIGIELPVGVQLPREDESMRRLPDHHASPIALGAVGGPLITAPADETLHQRFLHRQLTDVVGARPPAVESGGEHVEGALDAHIDRNGLEHGRRGCVGHGRHSPSSERCASAAFLNAASAWVQNFSK